jgi:hypothetical protein
MSRMVETQALAAVVGAAVDLADYNTVQDDLAAILGPRVRPISLFPAQGDVGSGVNQWQDAEGSSPPYWRCAGGTATGQQMFITIPWLRAGMRLTNVSARTIGLAAAAWLVEGYVQLVARNLDTSGAWVAVDYLSLAGDGDFTDTFSGEVHHTVYSNTARTVAAGYEYAIKVLSGGIVVAGTNYSRVSALWATVQQGA